jgi:hypothetical protein
MNDGVAILRWYELGNVLADEFVAFQPVQPACGWIYIQYIALQVFDEYSVGRVFENGVKKPFTFLEFISTGYSLHGGLGY